MESEGQFTEATPRHVAADNDTEETAAVFTNVELVDQQDPLERRAVLDGDFRFLFERGRPPQLF